MFLKAAINGGSARTSEHLVPVTTSQIVDDTRAVLAAGADVVHAHVRKADGSQTVEPEAVGEWVRATREVLPAAVIGTTTGLWTVESHQQRMDYLRNWPASYLPSFASVAFCEEGAAEAARLVLDRGMILESAVWSMADVEPLLCSATLHENVRILIEPETPDPVQAVRECREIAAVLRGAGVKCPILYHGFDSTAWPVLRAAVADGCEARIGFEDGLHLPDGSLARTNTELIRAALELAV